MDDHSHLSPFLYMRLKEVNSKDHLGIAFLTANKLRQTRCLKTTPIWDLTVLEGSMKSCKGRAGHVLLEALRGESVSLPLAAPRCCPRSLARGHFLYFRSASLQSLLPPSACSPRPSHLQAWLMETLAVDD